MTTPRLAPSAWILALDRFFTIKIMLIQVSHFHKHSVDLVWNYPVACTAYPVLCMLTMDQVDSVSAHSNRTRIVPCRTSSVGRMSTDHRIQTSVLSWWMDSTSCTACLSCLTDRWIGTQIDPCLWNMLTKQEEVASWTLNKYIADYTSIF